MTGYTANKKNIYSTILLKITLFAYKRILPSLLKTYFFYNVSTDLWLARK